MADLYGLEASGLPPELVAQLTGTQGRRKIAESMLQRGMSPIQVPQGTISWTQGLAQLLNAYAGRKGIEEADKEAQGIAEKRKSMVSDALANYEKQRMGQAMQTAPFQADTFPGEAPIEGLKTVTQQAIPADRRGAARSALASPFRELQNAASTDLKFDEMEEARTARADMAKAQREQAAADAAMRSADRRAQIDAQMERVRAEIASREAMGQQANDLKKYLGELVAASKPEPAPALATIADPNDPNKAIVVDARTNKKIGDSPKLTDTGKASQKKEGQMSGIGDAITQAEDILSGIRRGPNGEALPASKPTASGAGRLADAAAGLVGVALPGSDEAAKLEVLAGKLISVVPRFEGPQSDKDTMLYKQMAADVANSGKPLSQRLAALQTMKGLYEKQPGAFDAKKPAQSGGLSAAEQQELDQLRKRFSGR